MQLLLAMMHNGHKRARNPFSSEVCSLTKHASFKRDTSLLSEKGSLPKSTLQNGNRVGTGKGYLNSQPEGKSGAPRPGEVVWRGLVGSRGGEAKNIFQKLHHFEGMGEGRVFSERAIG